MSVTGILRTSRSVCAKEKAHRHLHLPLLSFFLSFFLLLLEKKKKMGQSQSNGRCHGHGCQNHHHHHHHHNQFHNSPHPHPSYYFHSSFPPPPPPSSSSYHFYGNPERAFNASTAPSWIPPPPHYSTTNKENGFWVSSSSAEKVDQESHSNADRQKETKTIRNVVNVHRDSIRVEPDKQSPDHSLISFTFDSVVDGSFTVFYFAKEGANCSFSLVYPEFCKPVTVPFQKGVNQKFCQPSGSGIDLRFFRLDELSTPSHGDVYPLVVYAGACSTSLPADMSDGQSAPQSCAQITEAVLKRSNGGHFQVKVINQILWVDGKRYELQEIFDLGISAEAELGDGDGKTQKECVICMSEPTDTAVLPCRHMCMCTGCAKALRLQSNRCPICRQPVEKIMEIPVQGKQDTLGIHVLNSESVH